MTAHARAAATSVVNDPLPLAAAAVLGAGSVWWIGLSGPIWCAVPVGLVIAVTGWHLSGVRLAVGQKSVVLAQGRFGPARIIPLEAITQVEMVDLSWVQIFGFGVRTTRHTTRLTVRPGRTLCLALTDGELIRVSIATSDVADVLIISTNRRAMP